MTPKGTGSLLALIFADANSTTTGTLDANSTSLIDSVVGGQVTLSAYLTNPQQGALSSTTFGFSTSYLGTDHSTIVGVEIAAAQPPQQAEIHCQAVNRAANWMRRASGLFTPEHERERILIPRLALSR